MGLLQNTFEDYRTRNNNAGIYIPETHPFLLHGEILETGCYRRRLAFILYVAQKSTSVADSV